MKKQTVKKVSILAADALAIPGLIFCEWLSDRMLATSSTCAWTLFGGKCITCGGTHFVNTILNFKFAEAFHHNEFLFVLSIVLAVSFVLLNLYWLFDLQFAKKVLKKIYNIPVLIVTVSVMLAFLLIRNIPAFIRIAELAFAVGNKLLA